jgi:hypothetical protein
VSADDAAEAEALEKRKMPVGTEIDASQRGKTRLWMIRTPAAITKTFPKAPHNSGAIAGRDPGKLRRVPPPGVNNNNTTTYVTKPANTSWCGFALSKQIGVVRVTNTHAAKPIHNQQRPGGQSRGRLA